MKSSDDLPALGTKAGKSSVKNKQYQKVREGNQSLNKYIMRPLLPKHNTAEESQQIQPLIYDIMRHWRPEYGRHTTHIMRPTA